LKLLEGKAGFETGAGATSSGEVVDDQAAAQRFIREALAILVNQ
jgi:hypothetical protein